MSELQKRKKKRSFCQRHFLLSAFAGTFVAALLILTPLFLTFSEGGAVLAAAIGQYREKIPKLAGARSDVAYSAQREQELMRVLEKLNRLNENMLAVDRNLERGLDEWQSDTTTAGGLEMVAASNEEDMEKLRQSLKQTELPSSLSAEERGKLKEIVQYMEERAKHSAYRQKHYAQLMKEVKNGKLKLYTGLYIEDTVKYMRLMKEIEYAHGLVYGAGGYRRAEEKLSEINDLEWAALARRGKLAEKTGDLAKAQELYEALHREEKMSAKGAGLVLTARLKRRQGDFEAAQQLLEQANAFWPGAAEGRGEYGACLRQGFL